jgi:hypothetical protein
MSKNQVILVAGSRTITPPPELIDSILRDIIVDPFKDMVISGGAKGVDSAIREFCENNRIPFKEYPADWQKYGKRAGPLRNIKMGKIADLLVLIWDGKSKGSKHMKEVMESLNKPVYEIILENS